MFVHQPFSIAVRSTDHLRLLIQTAESTMIAIVAAHFAARLSCVRFTLAPSRTPGTALRLRVR
jgi:hypothetical protein